MGKKGGGSIMIEWFNVTYRSVVLFLALVVALAAAASSYWYYFHVYAPRSAAQEAVSRAAERLGEASSLAGDEQMQEMLVSARSALVEAKSHLVAGSYDDARVAAIRSENLSLKILSISKGQKVTEELVRFYRIEGDVRVKKVGEFAWESADRRMFLQIGDQVKTSSSASAQLIYFDGTVTTIQPGSLLEIRELYENPVTKVRRVREQLSRGELKASTQDKNVNGSFHEVATEKVSARSEKEGEFRVAYDEEKRTAQFDVFKGQIEITSPTERGSLVAGERVNTSADGRLSAKEVLPGVPRLGAPRDQKVFIFEKPEEESITLTWESIAGAKSYHLMISNGSLFTDPLYDAARSGTHAVLDAVPPGSYYWKVAAITAADATGPFSATRRFRVSSQKIRDRSDTVPPELEITEFITISMMVIVNGKTEPGATLWINNEKTEISDDGTFYAVVRLRKEGMNSIRFVAQDTAGNETELSETAYVEIH
jgi:hypothetical protein